MHYSILSLKDFYPCSFNYTPSSFINTTFSIIEKSDTYSSLSSGARKMFCQWSDKMQFTREHWPLSMAFRKLHCYDFFLFMTSNLLKSYLVAILKLCNSQIDFKRIVCECKFQGSQQHETHLNFPFFPFTAIWLLLHDVLIKNWKMNSLSSRSGED